MNLSKPKRVLWTMCLWTLTHTAHAHDGMDFCEHDEALAQANLSYTSPLKNYQAYGANDVQPWAQSNQTVQHIGGWRAYAKEMRGKP